MAVTNAVGFMRFQWQRVETVEDEDGSMQRWVEPIAGRGLHSPTFQLNLSRF